MPDQVRHDDLKTFYEIVNIGRSVFDVRRSIFWFIIDALHWLLST